ncbi:DNA replication licensing factor MCM3 like protein 1 [Nosema granulosis]|uniref:DNA replication licensing factor MCM3 n=1 Tax=Nosema granulosis TaxID=83296 RepID=A0A9P6KZF9_9MICR|nr:DNA replication licensing factor MCM3 like protein 1 [Nosema granulosis]
MEDLLERFRLFMSDYKTESDEDYTEILMKKSQSNEDRMIFNLNDIRDYDRNLATELLKDPCNLVPYIEEEFYRITSSRIFFGACGSFGENFVNPRSLSSTFIGRMICIEGIVTSCSICRPKVMKSVHYNTVRNIFYSKDYRDSTMITKLPLTNTVYPTRDADGYVLSTEFGLSEYFDFQTVVLQELPENAPPGQLPRSIEVILTFDLVDSVKPGDRIKAYGIYKSMVFGNNVFPNKFRTVLIANNIEQRTKENEIVLNDFVITAFNSFASKTDLYQLIAPSIYGYDNIKKALALLLVGGNELVMKNGSRIRGDINILLVGDPSTAKSQLLRYVYHTTPVSVATTGKGSSGVGLTAAVVMDKDTGDKRLEAGAMVLADRGVVCIDEFDKMNDMDRVAIHEVMEQQTVTISKAGIHTTLNARCSVLAAANPIWGQYRENRPPQENVRLPESLLTRFDLIFITLDKSDYQLDQNIAKHVVKTHTIHQTDEENNLHELFRAYIQYCKAKRPVMTKEASKLIISEYTALRQGKNRKDQIVSVTPRMLETMIRLSTAHAKLRLSETVDEYDVTVILEMLKSTLFQKVVKTQKRTKREVEIEEDIHYDEETEAREAITQDLSRVENENVKKDLIINLLYEIRLENETLMTVTVNDILSRLDQNLEIEEEDVRNVLIQLSLQDIIYFEGDNVHFIN